MDFVKTSAETYISQKINIRQLLVVLRIVLIGRSKNLDNELEDVIIKAPIYLSVWWLQNLSSFLPSKSHRSKATKEF